VKYSTGLRWLICLGDNWPESLSLLAVCDWNESHESQRRKVERKCKLPEKRWETGFPPNRELVTGIQGPDISPLPSLSTSLSNTAPPACLIDALYTIYLRRSAAAVCNHFEFALRSHYLEKKKKKTGGYADTGRGTWNHADGGPRAPQLTLIGGPSRAHRPNLVLQPQNTASLAEHRVGCELCLSLSRFRSFYLSIRISKAFEVLKIKMLISKAQKEVCLIAL